MSDIYVKYTSQKGLIQENSGDEGVNIDAGDSTDYVSALKVKRSTTLQTSQESGVAELSGSILSLKGRQEGLHFHMGGHQYISNNSWFDKDSGGSGNWIYETDSAAFRWGFRSSAGAFDLDYGSTGTTGGTVAFGTGLSMTGSNGGIALGKKANTNLSATLDITGSNHLALAVTGSADIGGGAPDSFFAVPRLTNDQRNALTSVFDGQIIYNTSDGKFQGRASGAWVNLH